MDHDLQAIEIGLKAALNGQQCDIDQLHQAFKNLSDRLDKIETQAGRIDPHSFRVG